MQANLEEKTVPQSLTESDLHDPLLRACYLSGNAYLEVTAVDIISDLLIQLRREIEEPKSRSWMLSGVAHQLVDECQHAELLADRLEKMGFELGLIPVSTHTWDCYQAFGTTAEKIAAQQILQEGVGLDSSALNVERFRRVGDLEGSRLYEKITMDELNHVKLGVQLVQALAQGHADEVVLATKKRVAEIDPLPLVPQFVELKRRAGVPENWR